MPQLLRGRLIHLSDCLHKTAEKNKCVCSLVHYRSYNEHKTALTQAISISCQTLLSLQLGVKGPAGCILFKTFFFFENIQQTTGSAVIYIMFSVLNAPVYILRFSLNCQCSCASSKWPGSPIYPAFHMKDHQKPITRDTFVFPVTSHIIDATISTAYRRKNTLYNKIQHHHFMKIQDI